MSDNKKNKFTDNPVVKAIGTQRLIAMLALCVLFVFFCAASPSFRQYSTFVSIMDASYYIGFMAIGVTFAIITGGIDLSIGTVLVCSSLISGTLATKYNLPVGLCLLIGILIGALFGLCNGLMVSKMGLPPFIATLGTMMISKGLGSIFTRAQSVTWPQSTESGGWFRNIFKVTIQTDNGIVMIPTGFILLIVLAILMAVILNKTKTGRYILALGSNKEATRLIRRQYCKI